MRTIIIWQTSRGPVLVDKASASRIENCKQVDMGPIVVNQLVEATLHLWPMEVAGTVQHGLEPTLERVCVEFAPLFPSVVKCGVPDDFENSEAFADYCKRMNDVDKTIETCRNKFEDGDHFGQPNYGHPSPSGPGE